MEQSDPAGRAARDPDAVSNAPAWPGRRRHHAGTGGESAAWRAKLRELPAAARYTGQGLVYALVVGFVGFFATQPAYTYLAEDHALLKLSFSHAGQPLKPCRRYTHAELSGKKFSERSATSCERGRGPSTSSST